MGAFETKLKDGQTFRPEQWQLNEVIWASVKTPYFEQWKRWQLPANYEGSIADIFTMNWAQAVVRIEQNDGRPELIDAAALNLGKLAAGLSCSVAHLITPAESWNRTPEVWLPQQNATVDSVMASAETARPIDLFDRGASGDFEEMLLDCHIRASRAAQDETSTVAKYEMTVPLFNAAVGTTRTWLDFVEQHDGLFEMSPGGTPRSSGEYTEALRKASEHLFVK